MMTSTKFNVGLGDGRCSSRVLKPPGGGSSNIIFEGKEQQPMQQRKVENSDIKGCFNYEAEVISPKTKKCESEKKAENDLEKKQENIATPEKKSEPPLPAARVRVPPGGFSSGLW